MAEDSRVLQAVPMTRDGFAPFGRLIQCPGDGESRTVNEGTAERWDDQAPTDNPRPGAKLNVATFQARPRPQPFEVVTLERHPHSTQLFIPLHASRYVVIVADSPQANRADGSPTGEEGPGTLHAFVVAGDVGIAYAPGVWHHTLLVLDAPASFACFVFEDGSAGDCEVVELDSGARRTLGMP